jgi:hypothetical protein
MPWRHEQLEARPAREYDRIEFREVEVGDRITMTRHGHPREVAEVEDDGPFLRIRLRDGGQVQPPQAMKIWRLSE